MKSDWAESFLIDRDPGVWSAPPGFPTSFAASGIFTQDVPNGLEVVLASSAQRPAIADLRSAWSKRRANRASPVLLVVGYGGNTTTEVAVCGPAGEQPAIYFGITTSQIERISRTALSEPSHHAATRFLLATLPALEEDLPGLRNVGLLATQELRAGVPHRPDWDTANELGRELLASRGQDLVRKLGFDLESVTTNASVLTVDGGRRAIGVFLDESETFDSPTNRFGTSPVSHALAVADQQNLPWVVLTRGPEIRLYAARADTGVGRKGRAETFVEANLSLLPEDRAAYLYLLYSAEALESAGSVDQILDRSSDFAAELAVRLRERIYFEAVPTLARAIADRMSSDDPTDDDLAHAYEQVMIILFRVLFVAYAEDKDLLPYRTNSHYQDRSLSRIVRRIVNDRNAGISGFEPQASDLWEDVRQLWRAVDKGRATWGVPAYNGGLFSSDADVNPAGAALAHLELNDQEFGSALASILIDEGAEGTGPVDFRSLSVREFGTIYEGLLESKLSVAPFDLSLDSEDRYVPASSAAAVVHQEGAIYFHNRAGTRKSSGSYFTKPFVVEQLLDDALEPALDRHIERLNALHSEGDESAVAAAIFDFRCVDLAMGSAHFLVAAVDRIEARLSSWLNLNPVPAVLADIDALRTAAHEALGDVALSTEIESSSLIRRQVARRCVYGCDLTQMAVELSRLALWIHTFVPGLPLSFLNHNLVTGDSLTGIGSVSEAVKILDPGEASRDGQGSWLRHKVDGFLDRADSSLRRLATILETTAQDVTASREAHTQASEALEPARRLFDTLVSARLGLCDVPLSVDEDIDEPAEVPGLRPLHFPICFPEVFLRPDSGFDCILGNPPWDKVLFEPSQFWVVREPGLLARTDADRKNRIAELRSEYPLDALAETRERGNRERLQRLVEASYPLRGSGHYDFAKLFVERALQLTHENSTIGLVLPAASMLLGGWSKLRIAATSGRDIQIVQARNAGGWLFEDVHHSTAIVLLASRNTVELDSPTTIRACATNREQLRDASADIAMSSTDLDGFSHTRVIPWLNGPADVEVFQKLADLPSLNSGEGWITGRHDARWDFRSSGSHGRLLSAGGEWKVLQTRHVLQYGIDETRDFPRFVDPADLVSLGIGVAVLEDRHLLDEGHPIVIVRHPSRNDDSRTLIGTALPSQGFLHAKGYAHAVACPADVSPQDQLAFLGWMNSFVCDWWARRFVDRHVTAPVVNNLRVPNWSESDRQRASRLVACLLVAGGTKSVAGISDLSALADSDTGDARTELEVLAFAGADLPKSSWPVVAADFSEGKRSCPPATRSLIAKALEALL